MFLTEDFFLLIQVDEISNCRYGTNKTLLRDRHSEKDEQRKILAEI